MISTAPEIGEDYWSTAVIPIMQQKRIFGFLTRNIPDVHHQIASFIRNSMQDAHRAHAEVRHVVTSVSEDQWWNSFPRPTPPDGFSTGAREKLKNHLGYDPL
jgi:hypothetical protein